MRYELFTNKNLNTTARQILDAAHDLFLEKGYKKVTTRDIAKLAQVNLGLITYYFSSKENLANIVIMHINDQLYKRAFETDLLNAGSAEKLYVYTVLLWKYIDEDVCKFIFDFSSSSSSIMRLSSSFMELSWEVIKEYALPITPAKNEIYVSALKGAELFLLQRRNNNELNISLEDISNLILSNYFYNIGLSDKTIYGIVEKSKKILQKL